MTLSLLDSRSDTAPRPFAGDWRELFLEHVARDKKDGPAFVPAAFAPGGSRRVADVEAVHFAVYDVDEGAIDVAAVAARLSAAGVEHLIHSSHSHRAEKPALRVVLPLARPVPPAAWPAAWKRGAAIVGPGVSGKSRDAAHLYYLPSCPADHVGEAIRIYRPGARLDLLADERLRPAPAPRPAPTPVAMPVPRAYDPAEILAAAGSDPRVQVVYDGRPFPPGGRDEACYRAVSQIVFATQGLVSEASVVAFFLPTIEAMRLETPDDPIPLSKISDSYRRAYRDLETSKAAQAAQDAELRRALSPGVPDPVEAVIRAAATVGDIREEPDAAPDAAPPAGVVYSDEELARLAEVAGCTVAELPRRWIIQKGTAFFVLRAEGYAAPIVLGELGASLPRDLARAGGVQLFTYGKEGAPKPRAATAVIADHATVARTLVSSLVESRSRYDAATETFYEAVAPLRTLAPAFDERVDKWLRLLGGKYSEQLLDWVATVTDLSRPTCALYLIGRKGCGKTMLPHGLARLWTTGAPTSATQVLLADFNSAVAGCPLILADEALPKRPNGRPMSAEVRELIGSSGRPLTRKFLPDSAIVGAIRLVLAANNARLLSDMMQGEDRDAADIDAVSERFLMVRAPDEAAEYLEALGGRAGTDDWVSGDRIARHALWLRRNRKVAPAGRWLVAGRTGDLDDLLAVSGAVSSLVVEWVCRWLADGGQRVAGVPSDPPGILVGEGMILVRPGYLSEHLESYIVGQKTPTTHAVGRACASLAVAKTPKVYRQKAAYWSIRVDAIRGWAAEHMVGAVEDIDASVGGSLP